MKVMMGQGFFAFIFASNDQEDVKSGLVMLAAWQSAETDPVKKHVMGEAIKEISDRYLQDEEEEEPSLFDLLDEDDENGWN